MRRFLAVALAAVATALVGACGHDDRGPLRINWRESEGHPGCVYTDGAVTARLIVTGDAGAQHSVKVTVTAYADENTSVPVGSTTQSVPVAGTVKKSVDLTIAVTKPPHVDEDEVAACRLSARR